MDDSSGGKCEPVIVFKCMDLSIGQRVNVSGWSCVSNKVLRCWDSYKIIKSLLSVWCWSKGGGCRCFLISGTAIERHRRFSIAEGASRGKAPEGVSPLS